MQSMRGSMFGAKVWFGMLGTPGCGSGGAVCTKNWHFSHLDTLTRVSILKRNLCPMPALHGHRVNAIFERETLLKPKLQQRVCGKPAVDVTKRRTKAGRSGQAPLGHLRDRCLAWSTPRLVSINFDAAGCHAGRQGGAAGFRKIPGAYFSKLPPKQPPASSQQVATSALRAHSGVHLQAWECSWRVRAHRSFQGLCSGLAGVGWLAISKISHRDVAADYQEKTHENYQEESKIVQFVQLRGVFLDGLANFQVGIGVGSSIGKYTYYNITADSAGKCIAYFAIPRFGRRTVYIVAGLLGAVGSAVMIVGSRLETFGLLLAGSILQ
eukprot:1144854-Pelagomonas_calceolata.AAC.1